MADRHEPAPSGDSPGDDASEQRQLFGEQRETRIGFVACELGVARLVLAADRIGHVGVVERCSATSVAADETHLLVGTIRGVLRESADGFERLGDPFELSAVGVGESLVAASADNRVLRWNERRGWEPLGEVAGAKRFDGTVLAAESGVFRVNEGLEPLGLHAVSDVAVGAGSIVDTGEQEALFAATQEGLYRYVESGEWVREYDKATATVVTNGETAHAVDARGVLVRVDGDWEHLDAPKIPVDLAYGESLYGITGDGTVLISRDSPGATDEKAGWRTHSLGLRGVVECAIR